MAMTKLRMHQYKQFEPRLIARGEHLNINQIYDPENIRTLLCSDPTRERCYIKFTDGERALYACKEFEVKSDADELIEMYIYNFPLYNHRYVWYNDHLQKKILHVVSMPQRGVCICSYSDEEGAVKFARYTVGELLTSYWRRLEDG